MMMMMMVAGTWCPTNAIASYEHWVLVRQKHALVIDRSQNPVADHRIQDHYRRRQPEQCQ